MQCTIVNAFTGPGATVANAVWTIIRKQDDDGMADAAVPVTPKPPTPSDSVRLVALAK